MKILISNRSELPIYAQIQEQIAEQIRNGTLAEGTILPSIRQLAKELGVSVITTTRAYKELEEQGFIASRQGKGSVVLASNNSIVLEQYYQKIEQNLKDAIEAARQVNMSDEQMRELLNQFLKE